MEAVWRWMVDGEDVVNGFGELVDVERLGDDDFSVRGGDLFEDLGGGVEGIGGGDDGVEHRGGEESEDEFGGVLEEDHDGVPLFDAVVG